MSMGIMIEDDEDYLCAQIEMVGYANSDGKTLQDLIGEITDLWYTMEEDIRKDKLVRKAEKQRATRKRNEVQNKQSSKRSS